MDDDGLDGVEAVTYTVNTYYKRRKGSPGITHLFSKRTDAAQALGWIMLDLDTDDADAWKVTRERPEGKDWDVVTIVIDWNLVPDSIRSPKIPAPRR